MKRRYFQLIVVCLAIFVLQSGANAQKKVFSNPADYLSRDCVLLMRFQNLEESILVAHSTLSEMAGEGETTEPPFQVSASHTSGERYWLLDTLKSLADHHGVSEFGNCIQKLETNEVMAEGEPDRVAQKLASLFGGRAFFGLNKSEQGFIWIVGLENSADNHSWMEDLIRIEKLAPRKEKLLQVDGTELHYLKNEGIHFFSMGNSLFCVGGAKPSEAMDIASRFMLEEPRKDSLSKVYSFKRVCSSLPENENSDVLCFLRTRKLIDNYLKFKKPEPPSKYISRLFPATGQPKSKPKSKKRAEKIKVEDLGDWGTDWGATVSFGGVDAKSIFEYEVACPLLAPINPVFLELFSNALHPIDVNKPRTLMPVQLISFSAVDDKSQFPALRLGNLGQELSPSFWRMAYGYQSLNENENISTTRFLSAFDSLVKPSYEVSNIAVLTESKDRKRPNNC